MELTDNQFATILSIRTEPDYQFTGNERKVAERMVKKGLLKRLTKKRYKVTGKGEKTYFQDMEKCFI